MFSSRLRLKDVFKEANLSPLTWTRWSRGADPKASNLAAVRKAIETLTAPKPYDTSHLQRGEF